MVTLNPFEFVPNLTTLLVAVLSISVAMLTGLGVWSLATGGPVGQSLMTVGIGAVWFLAVAVRYDWLQLPSRAGS